MNGLYIHVPFCVKKCLYCDFYSVTDLALIDAYVAALVREVAMTAEHLAPGLESVDTVYFGGGTPSLLLPRHLETIIETVHRFYCVAPRSEITLEVNPGTVSAGLVRDYKTLGITRLSIGVQSLDDRCLKFLGRIHSAAESRALIQWARSAGFTDLGLDLIYGLPDQGEEHWRTELDMALSFEPAHLSCYMLTWEAGTPLTRRMEKGLVAPLDEEPSARLFETTMAVLKDRGFVHYEISNYARTPEKRSRHNQKYWDNQPYTGFGPSAHSYCPSENRRSWNTGSLSTYIQSLKGNERPVEETEVLGRSQRITEALFLGFRKIEGIDTQAFNRTFSCDFNEMFKKPLEAMIKERLVCQRADRVCLSPKGLLLADRITAWFVDHAD